VIIESKFRPSWWLRNPHLQTILASKLFTPDKPSTTSLRIELDDGDFIDLSLSTRTCGPVVALFHGLAGCVRSSYIQGVFNALERSGFRPMLMHWRGCSGEPNRLARAYHSGASDDIAWFIDYLAQHYSNEPIFAVGYSLGANALLKHLGESGQHCKLAGAMAICPPLVLAEGANQLNRGFARNYQRYLLSLMRAQHMKKRAAYPHLNLVVADTSLDTFWKFDDAITAPLHGYDGVDDYYTQCSARPFLPSIRIPTHILCAQDDPFFTLNVLPEANELASGTTLEISARGGHVGFLNGTRHGNRWLDERVASVLSDFRNVGASDFRL